MAGKLKTAFGGLKGGIIMARVFGGAIGTFRGKFGKLSARIVEGVMFINYANKILLRVEGLRGSCCKST
jgi:hypothetical protein